MMSKVLIAFYSRNGSTEALAKAIAEGASSAGAEIRMRRAREVVSEDVMKMAPGWLENARRMNADYEAPTTDDAVWADAVILGTPTRFGSVTSELKAWIDSLGGLWAKGALNGKAGSVRSEEHTSELQSLMRISYAVFCLKKKTPSNTKTHTTPYNPSKKQQLTNISINEQQHRHR